jgi:uncharacterized MAPEG superfamily protein
VSRDIRGDLSVKYTTELYCVAPISAATALMWVPYVTARMMTFGMTRATGTPGSGYPVDVPWAERARRAHVNAIENLAVFAPVVLVAATVGISNGATRLSTQVYLVARLAYYVVYAANIPVVRTPAFLIGSIASWSYRSKS